MNYRRSFQFFKIMPKKWLWKHLAAPECCSIFGGAISGNLHIFKYSGHINISQIELTRLWWTCVFEKLELDWKEQISDRKLLTIQFPRNFGWTEYAQFSKKTQSDIWNAASTQKWSIWCILLEIDSPSISITQTYIVPKSFGASFGPKNEFCSSNSIPAPN